MLLIVHPHGSNANYTSRNARIRVDYTASPHPFVRAEESRASSRWKGVQEECRPLLVVCLEHADYDEAGASFRLAHSPKAKCIGPTGACADNYIDILQYCLLFRRSKKSSNLGSAGTHVYLYLKLCRTKRFSDS